MQRSGEDYLEAILVLETKFESDDVRSTDIAKYLGVSKPSVSRAMSILKNDGYVNMEVYGEVSLTARGRAVAEEVYSRHRMLTFFFRDILGVEKSTAEHDACLIEHDISSESMQKLTDFIRRWQQNEEEKRE